ncbi:hypothetical protein C8C83_1290 [Flavobacterium sp. 90]|uniref:hypothetical protein n=1 Tax=unclassified Flavobacterium TaxID=196869 RepID=UPI000EB3D147|nr:MULTISPECIES: hypothetical protein [unclassified Flavobacterium]RKR09647.1 hypothetical protein C8C82_1591 [Flavobacterium sp. 81]TCK53431.1 hypothetical protein C8C83_1290 [Flavobacterium sp. 90]
MKKKIIISGIVLIIVVIAFIYFKYILGWLGFRHNNYTSKEFKSIVHVSKEQYLKDSLNLISIIRDKIEKHQDPYYSFVPLENKKMYLDNSFTRIYIDTIYYSPQLEKIAFLVITENEYRNLYKNISSTDSIELASSSLPSDRIRYYDGYKFKTERNVKTKKIDSAFAFSRYSFINCSSYNFTSNKLRENILNYPKQKSKENMIYNVDDIRFWESDIWSK